MLLTEMWPISFRPVTQSALANSADCAVVLTRPAESNREVKARVRFIVSSISHISGIRRAILRE
jgi:hypothetical protein